MRHPELYLVRHGETHWNRSRHFQGQMNSRLTPEGEDQARAVGRLVADIWATRGPIPVWCSPLGRCRQTVGLIFETARLDPAIIRHDDRLMELNCGYWQTWTRDEVKARWPDEWAAYRADLWGYEIPGGGENGPMLQGRARSWLADVAAEAGDGPVLAVSHGMIGRIIRGLCCDLSPDEFLALDVPQGVVHHLRDSGECLLTEDAAG